MKQYSQRIAGFTLIELIIVIVLLGVLGTVTIGILMQPFQAFQDQSRRASLVADADQVLTRMTREIRMALPNSVRITESGGNQYLEFIPTIGGGRYRALADLSDPDNPAGDVLDFSIADNSFDVLGGVLGEFSTDDHVVVFNASTDQNSSANAYRGDNRAVLTGGSSNESLHIQPTEFPFASLEAQRFDIVPQTGPVTYACLANQLRRYSGYGFQTNQPTGLTSGHLMASRIGQCVFDYLPGDHIRNGVVTLQLSITEDDETVEMLYQAQVMNTP
ncbi:PulJ/GspJ family protein [Nitrincola sp.]|uniref:PulJ/GspJ family protein n=1 Tax=Nitrincola sp. TaxID=1926584 RepID=UPI003A928CB9